MLEGLTQFLGRAKSLNLDDAWNYSVVNNYSISNKIKEWIIEQLDLGKDETGDIIGTYSFATERITNGRKKYNDPYNLKETGFFRGSIVVVPQRLQISVYANGQKEKVNIVDKYGLKIIGLMDENKEKLKEIILNEFHAYIKRTLYQG